jgi:hypothetical protein
MSGEEEDDDEDDAAEKEASEGASPSSNGSHANGFANGHSKSLTAASHPPTDLAVPAASPAITDLAQACVAFVERALGVKLDYTPETLPLLDHYLDMTRQTARDKPEAVEVVVGASAAYLGEVIRRRYTSWWRLEADAAPARIEFRDLFLSFSPADMIRDAILATSEAASGLGLTLDLASFELDDTDREAVLARLAELPAVSVEEYYAPSTRVEVLDIIIDAVRSHRLAAGDPELTLEPDDYR